MAVKLDRLGELMIDDIDIEHAQRMVKLSEFFDTRSVEGLLMDLHWLSQFLVFKQHMAMQVSANERKEREAALVSSVVALVHTHTSITGHVNMQKLLDSLEALRKEP